MPDNPKHHGTEPSERISERARALCEPKINELGYAVWDVIFEKEGAMRYLKILFDKAHDLREESGVTAEECEAVTKILNPLVDKEKFIENVDILEIGSPGLTRRLRLPEHFRACIGLPVRAAARGEKGKTVAVYGTLKDYSQENMTVTLDETVLEIKKCLRINLDL